MTKKEFGSLLEEMPVIAAVKNDRELEQAVQSGCGVVFLLYGNVCTIGELTQKIRQQGKAAIVHVDLIDGLESKSIAVDFLAKNTYADGIISTKPNLIKAAKEHHMLAIQRFFMIDSIAFENMKKHLEQGGADLIEVLPGVMPKIIRKIVKEVSVPVIAGGLISDKEDVIGALSAGAAAVSTTLPEVWNS
ncbi:MAG: glycerol-3-phosphate responsive antiterminator [Massiliimalia sp.]|jgi:glycerol uptake operon antiterminator